MFGALDSCFRRNDINNLVPEVAHMGEDHGHVALVGCLDNLFVSGGYLPSTSILIILGEVFSVKNTPVVTRTFSPLRCDSTSHT